MAQLKQGINGPGKGKVGNVIMYEMFGNTYLRSRPAGYKDKKSEKQLAQRQRLKLAQNLIRHLNPMLRITMKDLAQGRSAYHTAVSMNLKSAIEGDYPDLYIKPEKVIFSKGNLTVPEELKARKTNEGILLKWSTNKMNEDFNHPSDNLIWCVKDLEAFEFSDFQITTVKRHQGEALLPLPSYAHPVELWIMFRDASETNMSNTQWAGHFD